MASKYINEPPTESEWEQIEAFARQSMTAAEVEAWTKVLAERPALKYWQEQFQALEADFDAGLFANKLAAWDQEAKVRTLYSWRNLSIAAVILVLLGLAGLFWRNQADPLAEQMAITNEMLGFEEALIFERVLMSGNPEDRFQLANSAYQGKDWASAVPKLKRTLQDQIHVDTVKTMLANAYIGLGHADSALQYLYPLDTAKNELKSLKLWYLSIAYWQLQKTDSARKYFQLTRKNSSSDFQSNIDQFEPFFFEEREVK
ncbi:MAG: hypothetical protein AAF927_05965 [Bacteroidota bacterium]